MENKIYDVIARILHLYGNRGEISMQKLVRVIYLCDWKYSIEYQAQITNIEWKYLDTEFSNKIISAFNKGKIGKNEFSFETDYSSLDDSELRIVDLITELSLQLDTDDFMKLVYSTYPMIKKEKDVSLNLPDLAKDYRYNYEYVK